ncbi:MAG: phosphate acetyltransferase [Planctomycetes bacterium]|nr:phosphate acetyltransferase [Planctomycetota bacterium]
MSRALLIAPTGHNVGLTTITMGLVRAVERQGIRCGFLKPIAQSGSHSAIDRSVAYIRSATAIVTPDAIPRERAEALLGTGDDQVLMEEVVAAYQQSAKDADVVVVEGMVPGADNVYSSRVNLSVAKGIDADVVLVAAIDHASPAEVAEEIEIASRSFQGRVIGCVLNRVPLPVVVGSATPVGEEPITRSHQSVVGPFIKALADKRIPVVGTMSFRADLTQPRFSDVASAIRAHTLVAGNGDRRVTSTTLIARTVQHAVDHLISGSLVVTPGDRDDILMAAALAQMNGSDLAGLILTGGLLPDPRILRLCDSALRTGLSVSTVSSDSFATVTAINAMDDEIPADDRDRLGRAMDAVANQIDQAWVQGLPKVQRERRLSPPAFRHYLITRAHALARRIVLPEGDESRTVAAAAICAERGIARCILLAKPERVRAVAKAQGVTLPASVQIVDPAEHIERLIPPMCELRKAKGMTADQAREQLQDPVVVGTMMLKLDEVDGLVSGAVHTTANTIRPALQLIKLQPGMKLASSVFFMALPDQVLVFGDCAVNPSPTAEELADIAIQSADSAIAFGIPARVAMLSYSTGTSGAGPDVEKVDQATKLARQRRPDLAIDGPLQYDAAIQPEVAKSKAPNSPVAGKATVFVFPDLNAGNTAYKAVQRSTGCISIGPMMQGMAKPVNDLSRGCLVEDIVFTIALTAIQSGQSAKAATAH